MKRPHLPIAAALALSCVLLCGQASAASLTGLDLGAAYLADTNAENLTSETAFLNDAAQRFKLGGSCAQVELFDLDSAHYSYPGSAQVGALTAVTAAFKAGGYAVQALDHNADAKVTDDFFLATRGGLQVLGNVYGNANDASLEWCSLTTAAATPGARLPVPQPVPQIGVVKTTTPAPTPAAKAPAPVQPATQKAPARPAVPNAGDASAISGPPIINPAFGARMPRKCKPVTHVPSEAEAAALAQCATESGGEPGAFDPLIYLWQNVRVQMGKSRPYAYNADSYNSSIDTEAMVYPIRVTADQLSCTGKPTCMTSHADNAEGTCYKTTFGDWQCHFSQVFGVTKSSVELPAPKTY